MSDKILQPISSLAKSANTKPLLGFFYSVSKGIKGEYWPLYLGANTIGSDSGCSVCLKEATVTKKHATLVIRQMQNQCEDVGLCVFIQDDYSMCGTLVNGVALDFNPKECKSGDIITIGENYELFLILVDPKGLGLEPKKDFDVPVELDEVFSVMYGTPVVEFSLKERVGDADSSHIPNI